MGPDLVGDVGAEDICASAVELTSGLEEGAEGSAK